MHNEEKIISTLRNLALHIKTATEEPLREVRKIAMLHYENSDFEGDMWQEIIDKINSYLKA